MKSRIYSMAAGLLCLIFLSLPVRADRVFLKNGNTLEVETSRLEGDQVCFVFKGMEASIPQSKVVRVEKSSGQSPASVAPANRGSARSNEPQFQTSGKFAQYAITQAAGDATDPTQPPAASPKPLVLCKDGLQGLKWSTRLSHLPGMELKPTDSGLPDVVEYMRPQDVLKLGDIDLTSVVYAFWREQLYTISIWTEGQKNFKALHRAALAQFGKSVRIDGSNERYLWTNDTTDAMLKQTGEGQYGLLWMRCKDLDRKMKLSKLNRHTSFVRRMKSMR